MTPVANNHLPPHRIALAGRVILSVPRGISVSEEYQVPKRKLPVRVAVVGHAPRATNIFLAHVAEGHAHGERPSDLLNGHGPFIPMLDDDGTFAITQKKFILFLTCAYEEELGGDDLTTEDLAAEEAVRLRVELDLSDGQSLAGTLVYLLPKSSQRLLDYLRVADTFFVLRGDEQVHLVNIEQVVRFRQIEDS